MPKSALPPGGSDPPGGGFSPPKFEGGGGSPALSEQGDLRTLFSAGEYDLEYIRSYRKNVVAASTYIFTSEPCIWVLAAVCPTGSLTVGTQVNFGSHADPAAPLFTDDPIWAVQATPQDYRESSPLLYGRVCPGGICANVTSGASEAVISVAWITIDDWKALKRMRKVFKEDPSALKAAFREGSGGYARR